MPIETAVIDTLIHEAAEKYSVNEDHLYKTIECESRFNIEARGDSGHSRGLAQIHNEYHPEVSDEEADDPTFAIDFMAKAFADGHEREWSCWRSLEKAGW